MGLVIMEEAVFNALKAKIEEIAKVQNKIMEKMDRENSQ
jgi:hypothetical protein